MVHVTGNDMGGPLFVCHANCCRSVLARYLYQHLCNKAPAASAGLDPGDEINDRASAMLRAWGIDASDHRPMKLSRDECVRADGVFIMAPPYVHRLILEYGDDLAGKAYLFADPFSRPMSFTQQQYTVRDPSFDNRPTRALLQEYQWMRERVLEIRLALLGHGRQLIPASEYMELCRAVDPMSH
jgi:protein-tyrosine-phosphatase